MKLDDEVKKQREEDLEWIKKFSKITIIGICKDLNINKSNLFMGKTSPENTARVKEEILKRVKELG